MGSRRRRRLPEGEFEALVVDMAHDGRGVARVEGKATFLHGGLPGERVRFRYTDRRRSRDEGRVVEVLEPSPHRVEPRCAHYGTCGGCSLQHLDPAQQVAVKQKVLLDNLRQIGRVEPKRVLEPLVNASPWGYRRKARLGVKDVTAKGGVLVGFRERGSSLVAELDRCEVLHPKVGGLLPALRELIESLSIRRQLPQIEMAMDDERCVLILRVLQAPDDADRARLSAFARAHDLFFYLQPGGPETVLSLDRAVDLSYALPAHDLELGFLPGDFTQVNTGINRAMVARALELLDLEGSERVLDLFCGVGNFTLPIARRSAAVVGIEGDPGLVERARGNARRNRIENAVFHAADLYGELAAEAWLQQRFDKALLDPPRSGAQEVLHLPPRLGVRRLVYVSCYPGTLARDAGILVGQHGYRLHSAGVMDMFPHTAHVESIALFEKD